MKRIGMLILLLCFFTVMPAKAAEEQAEAEEQIFSQFDFGELDQFVKKLFPDEKISFKDTILGLISGEIEISAELFVDMFLDQFTYEIRNTKTTLVHILILAIIAAVFHNFSDVFRNSQVSELSFYVLYMLLITICLNSFRILTMSALNGIGTLLEFLQLLGPVYFLAVAITNGSVTSVAFYNLILFLIYIVEILIQNLLLPLVQVYMVIRILNDLSYEEYLSKFADLLQTIITWSLRSVLSGVVGINLIQGLLSPAIDSVKRSVLMKGGESLPIIGDAIGGVTEVLLGTAVLIRNGIGVAGAIICIAICLSPVIQMAVSVLLYKLTAALIQPVSEKRIVGCISSMADGATILLRIIFTSCLLFLITIAMVAATTS